MAIYHFSTKIISRSKGQSAVACAAYRAGDKLYDERYDTLQDYTKKSDVIHSEIILPDHAPAWMQDREKLWNHIEKIEARKDARLAREFEIALPRELTNEQNTALIKEFINEKFTSKGLVTDLAIHDGVASDGGKQPHAHLMVVERDLDGDGFGKKYRELNTKENLYSLRKDFANTTNKHLALNGHDIQVDHRSLREQGIDLIPQKKIGPTGSFSQMASYLEHIDYQRQNGERLLANPEIVFDVLTNQQSTFTHHDIARVVSRYTADGDQFLTVYEKAKASSELVSLGFDDKRQERFTTKGMLTLEGEMIENANSLHQKNSHSLRETSIDETSKKYGLSAEQGNVLSHVVADGDLKNVVGYAGTGKSRFLGAAKELWEKSGYRVFGATLSGVAAENLEASSGIESRTLASRLFYWERGEQLLTSKDILVIDEAGMIGSRQMATIMEEANKRGAKVILVGDPEQLQAIQAGAAFRGILELTSHVELTEIWRQRVDWQKEATIEFASNKTAEAMARYAAHDCIHEYETKDVAKRAMVDAWNDARISDRHKTQMMFAFTRDEVRELNSMGRSLLRSSGELGEDHKIATVNGERQFAEGDRIYFLKNDKKLSVSNGTIGNIINIDKNLMTVKLCKETQKEEVIQFSMERYRHIDYGYAATVYKGQGGTYDRAYTLASKYDNRHSTYVALTRHRDGAEVFWSKDEFPSFSQMIKSLSRENLKDVSLDYPNALNEYEKASFATRRGFDGLWETFLERYAHPLIEKIKGVALSAFDEAKAYVEQLKNLYPEHVKKLEELNAKVDDFSGGFIDTREQLLEKYANKILKAKNENKSIEQTFDKEERVKGASDIENQPKNKSQSIKTPDLDKGFEMGD